MKLNHFCNWLYWKINFLLMTLLVYDISAYGISICSRVPLHFYIIHDSGRHNWKYCPYLPLSGYFFTFHRVVIEASLGGGNPEGRWPVDLRTGPEQWEAPHPLPCPWKVRCACPLRDRVFPRTQPWDSNVVLRLDSIHDWTQLKPVCKLLRFGGQVWRSTCLAAA